MNTSIKQLKVIGFQFYFAVIILSFAALMFSGCQSGRPLIGSSLDLPDPDTDPNIREARYKAVISDSVINKLLEDIETIRKEIETFSNLGVSKTGTLLNISLGIGVIIGGALAAVQSTDYWKRNAIKRKQIFFWLSVLAACNSGLGFFLKAENDKFLSEQKNQYTVLAADLSSIITSFDSTFSQHLRSDSSIPVLRNDVSELASETLISISKKKTDFATKYNLAVFPSRPRQSP